MSLGRAFRLNELCHGDLLLYAPHGNSVWQITQDGDKLFYTCVLYGGQVFSSPRRTEVTNKSFADVVWVRISLVDILSILLKDKHGSSF